MNEVLNKGKTNSKRIIFNEITKTALQNAVNNPTIININMFNAQQARRIIDRLVGFLISPMLRKNIQSSYKKGQGLSAGRVQSVVNKLIIERENSIRNFQRKDYIFNCASIFTGNASRGCISDRLTRGGSYWCSNWFFRFSRGHGPNRLDMVR